MVEPKNRKFLNESSQLNMGDDFSLSIAELGSKTNDFLLKLRQQ